MRFPVVFLLCLFVARKIDQAEIINRRKASYPRMQQLRGGIEDTRLQVKAKLTKKSEAKTKDRLPRTDPLEAKDRNARDHGPRAQRADVL